VGKSNILFLFLFLALNSFNSGAVPNELDLRLEKIIRDNQLSPLKKLEDIPQPLSFLGGNLFAETLLSGPKDISCMTCHHPMNGTGDSLPFPIGTGGVGMGRGRIQQSGLLSHRNSQPLYNLGYPEIEHMFWDGRVYRNSVTGELSTPVESLNGSDPQLIEVTKVFKSSVSVQAIFPLINDAEMRGKDNDIADAKTDEESWEAIMKRLLEGEGKNKYRELFKKAYPGTKKFNIGHVGQAIGAFIQDQFYVADTPYDRYLAGDLDAMTDSEKRGLIAFTERGKCMQCHNGPHLSNFLFKTVATPQFNSTVLKEPYDQGRYEVTKQKRDLFKFKTPALRNLALTAPYMHNGAFATIEEAVDHYNDPKEQLEAFSLERVDLSAYTDEFVLDRDSRRNKLRVNLISIGEVRRGINLTPEERLDLIQFLKTGLLDYRFQRGRSLGP
tara:strand:- start:63642 stop:64964 length:1323 start_codon:yes stop_codon:yes gene_type:complete